MSEQERAGNLYKRKKSVCTVKDRETEHDGALCLDNKGQNICTAKGKDCQRKSRESIQVGSGSMESLYGD